MSRVRDTLTLLAMAGCSSLLYYRPVHASYAAEPAVPRQETVKAPDTSAGQNPGVPGKLIVTVGKSLIIDSPLKIERISLANGDLAEAVAVKPNEILINGKMPGETSLIIWQLNGARLLYDLTVRMSGARLDAVRQQIARDFPNSPINVTFENDTAFVRGTVQDVNSSERIMAITATLGKAVNLLRVRVPPVEPQVVLRVRFANVDRAASTQLAANFFTGAFNQNTAAGTGGPIAQNGGSFSLSTAVNIFLQRTDINLAAAIQALQSKNLLQMLAEPNLLAISGQQASFLAGGEFPFPMVQPSAGATAISIMWREYGVRLSFVPTVTPQATIRLKVAPEVSSLDYTNSVTVEGVTIPGLSTRRVQTEVELASGQSFVIAGLLDNQTTEALSKVPGIGDIPVLGKLFQSKTLTRNNSELLVIITPEIVRPIPANQKLPDLNYPQPFLPPNSHVSMSQPGADQTGQAPARLPVDTLPVELLAPQQAPAAAPAMPSFQLVPIPPPAPPANPGLPPAPMSGQGGAGK